jgi:hypothetical protein
LNPCNNITDLRPKPEDIDYFGACPVCHRSGVHVFVGREDWFACHRHRVKWLVGENLFSCWIYETENELIAGAARIGGYRVAAPRHKPLDAEAGA